MTLDDSAHNPGSASVAMPQNKPSISHIISLDEYCCCNFQFWAKNRGVLSSIILGYPCRQYAVSFLSDPTNSTRVPRGKSSKNSHRNKISQLAELKTALSQKPRVRGETGVKFGPCGYKTHI